MKTYGQPDFKTVARVEEPDLRSSVKGGATSSGASGTNKGKGSGASNFSSATRSPGANPESQTRIDESGNEVPVVDNSKGSACCTIF